MSLINEALKRTNAAGGPSAPAPADYRVAPSAPKKSRRYVGLVLGSLLGLVALSALVAGGWQYRQMRRAQLDRMFPVSTTPPPLAPPPTAPVIVAPPVEVRKPVASPEPVAPTPMAVAKPVEPLPAPAVAITKPVEPPPPPPAPVVVPPSPPRERPKLELLGIGGPPSKRDALINGHFYRVGDDVEGATIVAIEERSVRLRFDGVEFTLRMN